MMQNIVNIKHQNIFVLLGKSMVYTVHLAEIVK